VWVAPRKGDRRIHHRPPIHWVKSKKTNGYVPFHPRDVKGQPPVNRRHDVYAPDKKGENVERLAFDPKDKIDALPEPPKEFRKPQLVPLAHAEEPTIAAHELKDGLRPSKVPGDGNTIRFDKKSQGFVVDRKTAEAEHNESRPIEGRTSNLRTRDNHVETRTPSHISTPRPTHISTPHVSHAPASHGGGGHSGGASHGGGGHTGGGGHHR
jgi:uncharacterized membrane protein YgcG